MSFKPYANRKSRPWRKFLTSDEAAKLGDIDKRIGEIDAERRLLSFDRRQITNRASRRAAAAAVREGSVERREEYAEGGKSQRAFEFHFEA
jgi:hypothetical protein